jgi:excisionase family DNA binding protein
MSVISEQATAADVLTAAQVAAWLQLPVRSVHQYAERGELPSVRIGRHRRFSRAAIERLVSGDAAKPRARAQA